MKQHPRGNLDFALEEHLLLMLHKTLPPQLLLPNSCFVQSFRKFQVGMTIPDLVVIFMRPGDNPMAIRKTTLSLFECSILADVLKRKRSRPSILAKRLYARTASIIKAVKKLVAYGLLSSNKNGTLSVRRRGLPPVINVISVEAKLRRWKEAINQAKEYLSFSDSAYVALPEKLMPGDHRINHACSTAGVGLIRVSQHYTEVVLKPKRRAKQLSAERLWLIHKAAPLCRAQSAKGMTTESSESVRDVQESFEGLKPSCLMV